MVSQTRTLSVAAAALCALAATPAQGYYKYVALLPNGDNIPDTVNVGHVDDAGEQGVNDFGEAFAAAGNEWNTQLCQEDTDGDGYTNGQEMGDPCCTWTTTNTADLITDGVSHPSDSTKIPTNDELLAGCSTTSTTSTSGDGADDVVGTVQPAGSSSEMPADDDEDDSSESAIVEDSAAAVPTSAVAVVAMTLACAAAVAL